MGLKRTFQKAAQKAFTVFKDAVFEGTYYSIRNTGFAEDDTPPYPVSVIIDSFSEKDASRLPFGDLIQPQDAKGLIQGIDITTKVNSQSDKVSILEKDGSTSIYTVVAYTLDALGVLFILLLRKT